MTVSAVYFWKRGAFKGGYRRSDAGADGGCGGWKVTSSLSKTKPVGQSLVFQVSRISRQGDRMTGTVRINLQKIPAVILFTVSVRLHLTRCLQS